MDQRTSFRLKGILLLLVLHNIIYILMQSPKRLNGDEEEGVIAKLVESALLTRKDTTDANPIGITTHLDALLDKTQQTSKGSIPIIKNKGTWDSSKKRWRPNTAVNRTIPPLFWDRLNKLIPLCKTPREGKLNFTTDGRALPYTPCDDNIRFFAEDIEHIEKEVLKFNIPKPIIVHLDERSGYVSIQMWRWINMINNKTKDGSVQMCPNCHLRHPLSHLGHHNNTNINVQPDELQEPAHVRMMNECSNPIGNAQKMAQHKREHPDQVLLGGCGESSGGTGGGFWNSGFEHFDYAFGFYDVGHPFQTSYAHLHLSPTTVDKANRTALGAKLPFQNHSLPELRSVSDVAKLLLRTPPAFPRYEGAKEDASFSHNNCAGPRGKFVEKVRRTSKIDVACYGRCYHNQDAGLGDAAGSCKDMQQEEFYHWDCEAHRDSSKTIISSRHKFTFSLENTLSRDYVTEKRYQALWGASVPIVWGNDNSLDFLPDPEAAFIIAPDPSDTYVAAVGEQIHLLASKEQEEAYLNRFFAWKKKGLRAGFARRLFMSSDYIACRICEYMYHHHFYD